MSDLTQFDGLSRNDLRAFDVIGYDVKIQGGAGGTVNTSGWSDAEEINVADVLEARFSRSVIGRSVTRRIVDVLYD